MVVCLKRTGSKRVVGVVASRSPVNVSVVESAGLVSWPAAKARKRGIDPAVISSWGGGVLYVHPFYDGQVRTGARYVAAYRLLGRTVVLMHAVEDSNPGFGWKTSAVRPQATVTVALSLRAMPQSTVDLAVDIEVLGAARLASPLLSWTVRRSARRAVRRVARNLSAPPAPALSGS
jgi:hypothetical protein